MPLSFLQLRRDAQDSISDLPALKHAAHEVAAHIHHGTHGQKKAGGAEKFWQFREYNSVDRPQDIDWRQSAKSDHIFVREKELQTPQSIYFWAKNDPSMDFQSGHALHSKQDAARVLSLALALLFQRSDEQIGVLGQTRTGHSDAAIDRVGTALLDNISALPEGTPQSKSALILCSDFLEPLEDIESSLEPLSSRVRQGIVLQVLDPAERDLPYDGRALFEGIAQDKHRIDNVASIRDAYQEKINAHIESIAQLCASYGWLHIVHVTDRPLAETASTIWEAMQR